MSLVRDVMRISPAKYTNGVLGVEIEVEGKRLPVAREFWRNELDGSLRGEENREFVLEQPSSLLGVKKAINYLKKAFTDNKGVIDDSVRAGVHVHVNCQDLTMVELYNFFTGYLILENVLLSRCGEGRVGNLFCLRAEDAEYLLYALTESVRQRNWHRTFRSDELRYASMNIKALTDYGSLEFRAMRTPQNLDVVYDWAKTLYKLREACRKFKSPTEMIETFSIHGADWMASRLLGDDYHKYYTPSYALSMRQGMRRAQEFAFAVIWEDLFVKKEEPALNKGFDPFGGHLGWAPVAPKLRPVVPYRTAKSFGLVWRDLAVEQKKTLKYFKEVVDSPELWNGLLMDIAEGRA